MMTGYLLIKALVLIGLLSVTLSVVSETTLAQSAPVQIIFDTDMAEDVDDVGALALLHALADRGEAEILATTVSARNEFVVPCLDAINTYYGRPDIPIGYVRPLESNSQIGVQGGPAPSKYAEQVAKRFPHDLNSGGDAPDAAKLHRKILAAQPDHSIVIVTVGFLTNIRDLLDSGPDEFSKLGGEALVRQKVKLWVCMGGKFPEGLFPDGGSEYNVNFDTVASVRAINDWPTPIVFSGFEIGARVLTGQRLGATPEENPVRAGYFYYNGLKHRESWDQTAVLFAVRGERDYWTLSELGFNLMHARARFGYNEWIPTPRKQHRYLIEKMPPANLAQVIENLMTQPPKMRENQRRRK